MLIADRIKHAVIYLRGHHSVSTILADFEHKIIALAGLEKRKLAEEARHNRTIIDTQRHARHARTEAERAAAVAVKIRALLA